MSAALEAGLRRPEELLRIAEERRRFAVIYRFGAYELDTDSVSLKAGAASVALEPQVFSLLQFLIEHRDRVVSKDELIAAVWQGRIVSDSALTYAINAARKAAGDDGKTQKVIRTFPKRGFRFVAEVANDDETRSSMSVVPSQIGSNPPSIAVLAFNNLTDNPDQEYFSDGITEDIITALCRFRQFTVISRNTTFTYKGAAVDIQKVARDLHVRYVLEGSVRKLGEKVRITAQLIEAANGTHVWAEKYDCDLNEIFEIQDEITRMVASAIEPEITKAEHYRVATYKTEDMSAWDKYVQGLHFLSFPDAKNFSKAKRLFHDAIRIDPGFAPAYSSLAFAETFETIIALPTAREAPEDSIETARRAIELDNRDAAPHIAIGLTRMMQRNYTAAIEEAQAAIDLNPSAPLGYLIRGFGRACLGQIEPAIKDLDTSIRLSPRDIRRNLFFARKADCYIALEDYEEAAVWGRKGIEAPRPQIFIFTPLISALGHLDRPDEAKDVISKLHDLRSDVTVRFFRERFPAGASVFIDRYVEGLRKAGLPEE